MDKAEIRRRILSMGYDDAYADEMIGTVEAAEKNGITIPDKLLFAPPPTDSPGYPEGKD